MIVMMMTTTVVMIVMMMTTTVVMIVMVMTTTVVMIVMMMTTTTMMMMIIYDRIGRNKTLKLMIQPCQSRSRLIATRK